MRQQQHARGYGAQCMNVFTPHTHAIKPERTNMQATAAAPNCTIVSWFALVAFCIPVNIQRLCLMVQTNQRPQDDTISTTPEKQALGKGRLRPSTMAELTHSEMCAEETSLGQTRTSRKFVSTSNHFPQPTPFSLTH